MFNKIGMKAPQANTKTKSLNHVNEKEKETSSFSSGKARKKEEILKDTKSLITNLQKEIGKSSNFFGTKDLKTAKLSLNIALSELMESGSPIDKNTLMQKAGINEEEFNNLTKSNSRTGKLVNDAIEFSSFQKEATSSIGEFKLFSNDSKNPEKIIFDQENTSSKKDIVLLTMIKNNPDSFPPKTVINGLMQQCKSEGRISNNQKLKLIANSELSTAYLNKLDETQIKKLSPDEKQFLNQLKLMKYYDSKGNFDFNKALQKSGLSLKDILSATGATQSELDEKYYLSDKSGDEKRTTLLEFAVSQAIANEPTGLNSISTLLEAGASVIQKQPYGSTVFMYPQALIDSLNSNRFDIAQKILMSMDKDGTHKNAKELLNMKDPYQQAYIGERTILDILTGYAKKDTTGEMQKLLNEIMNSP